MSKMVSARVPDAVFDQAGIELKALGASPSDLVNAAFEYVLKERKLPGTDESKKAHKTRKLSPARQEKLSQLFQRCTLKVDIPGDVAYDKRAAHAARAGKYENNA